LPPLILLELRQFLCMLPMPYMATWESYSLRMLLFAYRKAEIQPKSKVLVPLIKHMGNKLIAIVSNTDSLLAQQADYVIKAFVEKEACPNNLAPTTSTTAQMVIGDALAICLLKEAGFFQRGFCTLSPRW
jgi:arabinose-5-phosphate isomerase